MKNKNKVYWVWLQLVCRPASRLAVNLLRIFDDPERIFHLDAKEILDTKLLTEKDRAYSELMTHDISEAEDIVSWCQRSGVEIITPDDKAYPQNLYSLRDAPIVLYSVGTMPDFNKVCAISVVGSRNMTDYGRVNAFRFGYGLAKGGALVVSGLALGIDGMSMASALAAGGDAVGVIGSGIDVVYPKEHTDLFKKVIKCGAVVTEYPPGARPSKSSFPQRNRIISGLSQGTLVIEAARDSGALITARHAVYQGKDLFSVPGDVDSLLSEGTNNLIKEGAFAVTDPVDILERYEYVYPHSLHVYSARHAFADVDLAQSAERTALKYGVTTESDRDRVYTRRPAHSSIVGATVVRSSDNVNDEYVVPSGFGERPGVLEADRASSKKVKKGSANFKGKEPMRVDFELLGDTDMKVYNAMKSDTPMIPEELISDELSISEIMASLTMLEIAGAVEAGAGGYFMKCSDDAPKDDEEE